MGNGLAEAGFSVTNLGNLDRIRSDQGFPNSSQKMAGWCWIFRVWEIWTGSDIIRVGVGAGGAINYIIYQLVNGEMCFPWIIILPISRKSPHKKFNSQKNKNKIQQLRTKMSTLVCFCAVMYEMLGRVHESRNRCNCGWSQRGSFGVNFWSAGIHVLVLAIFVAWKLLIWQLF